HHPLAMQPVGPLASALPRRGGRDREVDLAAETRQPRLQLHSRRRLSVLDHLALPVASRRPPGGVDLGEVALVEADEALRELRRTAEQDEQQARGEGIERAGVPGACAGPLPQISDDREGRWTFGLVDEDEPRWIRRPAPHALSRIPTG